MANRYWIGGTGNWSDTAHWSATSGGSGGEAVPTSADNVYIDTNSSISGGTITLTTFTECNDFICTSGVSYILAKGTQYLNIYGSVQIELGLSMTGGRPIRWQGSGNITITCNGGYIPVDFDILGPGTITLLDKFRALGLTCENGIFNANDQDVELSHFYGSADTNYVPTINMGSGVWTVGVGGTNWAIDEYSGEIVTLNADTSTIKMNSIGSNTHYFVGAGKTYHNLWLSGNTTGTIEMRSGSIFNDIRIDAGLKIAFENNTTTTVNSFTATGEAGKPITIKSVLTGGAVQGITIANGGSGYATNQYLTLLAGNRNCFIQTTGVDGNGAITSFSIYSGGTAYSVANNIETTVSTGVGTGAVFNITSASTIVGNSILSKVSGVVECDYLNVSYSNTTGGATWYAGSNSTDSGNNTGWLFQDAPGSSSGIKSFNGLLKTSVKSVDGLASASVKSINGLA